MEEMAMVHRDDMLDVDDWRRSTLIFIFDFLNFVIISLS
jgi:hypothetical protein